VSLLSFWKKLEGKWNQIIIYLFMCTFLIAFPFCFSLQLSQRWGEKEEMDHKSSKGCLFANGSHKDLQPALRTEDVWSDWSNNKTSPWCCAHTLRLSTAFDEGTFYFPTSFSVWIYDSFTDLGSFNPTPCLYCECQKLYERNMCQRTCDCNAR